MVKIAIFTFFLLSLIYGYTEGLRCYYCGIKGVNKPCSSTVTANEVIDCSLITTITNLTATCTVSYY
jgi:hypothetical protein